MARLVPCLVALRSEFDEAFPGRDRESDGWIGDRAHQATQSDHNEDERGLVHAIDVDDDLGEGASMQDVVDELVDRCRSGAEKRLTYVIYDRRIASASHGWVWRPYAGPSPHTEHAHFSASDVPARETDTAPWHLEDVPVALTAADKAWLSAEIRKVVTGDADPTDRVYSLGGLVAVTERRTDEIRDRLDAIEKKLGI
jgi:hypothetical protein